MYPTDVRCHWHSRSYGALPPRVHCAIREFYNREKNCANHEPKSSIFVSSCHCMDSLVGDLYCFLRKCNTFQLPCRRELHPSFPPMRSHHNFPINGPNSWGPSQPKTTPSRKSICLCKSTYGLQLKGTQLKGIKHAAKGQKYGVEMKTVMQSNRLAIRKMWQC